MPSGTLSSSTHSRASGSGPQATLTSSPIHARGIFSVSIALSPARVVSACILLTLAGPCSARQRPSSCRCYANLLRIEVESYNPGLAEWETEIFLKHGLEDGS